jgi:uroporphyrinogen decarboxylase
MMQRQAQMTRTERVRAAVAGQSVDRVPVCFWHHFRPEGSGARLADLTYRFFVQTFDLDIVKVMPDIPYAASLPQKVTAAEDWAGYQRLDPDREGMAELQVAIRDLRGRLGQSTPIILTVFSPLTVALGRAGRDLLLEHAERHPSALQAALETIADNLARFCPRALDAGADGIFFALQGCSRAVFTPEQYARWGRPYDLRVLSALGGGWLNVLHVHGERDLMFESVLDYPVAVYSWSDRLAGPSLAEARRLTNRCLMGGLHEFGALSKGPAQAIEAEAADAVAQTGGRGHILANGCSVPDDTPEQWLHVLRAWVERTQPGAPA